MNETQLDLKFNWSQSSIVAWSEYIRLLEHKLFYEKQVKHLELECTFTTTKKIKFIHHFDGSVKELDIPTVSSELKKAKLEEFRAGASALAVLVEKAQKDFNEEVVKQCVDIFDNNDTKSQDFTSKLPKALQDALKTHNSGEASHEQVQQIRKNKLDNIKELGTYTESKIESIRMFFASKTKQAINEVELNFVLKKSRNEAKSNANLIEKKLESNQEDLDALLNAIEEQEDEAPGHIARSVSQRRNQQ